MKQSEIAKPCTCETCRDMCFRPCWPTPQEAAAIIQAGFGHRLMADYWASPDGDILILCGSLKTRLRDVKPHDAPNDGVHPCTFFVKGRCQLHKLDLKPMEGALATCSGDESGANLHRDAAMAWDNPAAQRLAKAWIARYGRHDLPPLDPPRHYWLGGLRGLFG